MLTSHIVHQNGQLCAPLVLCHLTITTKKNIRDRQHFKHIIITFSSFHKSKDQRLDREEVQRQSHEVDKSLQCAFSFNLGSSQRILDLSHAREKEDNVQKGSQKLHPKRLRLGSTKDSTISRYIMIKSPHINDDNNEYDPNRPSALSVFAQGIYHCKPLQQHQKTQKKNKEEAKGGTA